jgi:hypothetical protein
MDVANRSAFVLALQVQQYHAARRVDRKAPRVRRTTMTVSGCVRSPHASQTIPASRRLAWLTGRTLASESEQNKNIFRARPAASACGANASPLWSLA